MVRIMRSAREAREQSAGPSHVPSGAVLLAIELSEIARGIRGLDVLRRSVDRAPPAWSGAVDSEGRRQPI